MYRWLNGLVIAPIMVGVLLLASCSPPPSPSTRETTTPGKAAASPTAGASKPTGSLVAGVDLASGRIFTPSGMGIEFGFNYRVLGSPIFDSLVGLDKEGQLRPGLAERWEIAKDGMAHTFYIRKGVKFHDGSDLTGADVKFTFDGILSPENVSPPAINWRKSVDRVELKDDYTVVIRMKQPQYEFLPESDNLGGMMAVFPKKYIEEKGYDYFTKNPVGSGPWKVVKLTLPDRMELEAVDNHWRETPKFKNLTLVSVKEMATKTAMLKTGELDLADSISPDSVAGLKAAGIRTYGHYGGGQVFAWPLYDVKNPKSDPLGDLRVRKAMQLSVNSQEVADKVYAGFGRPSYMFYAPKTGYFFDPATMKPDPFDPEGAKKLLGEAGYPNGVSTIVMDYGGGGVLSTLVQVFAGYWKTVGINAQILPVDITTVLTPMRQGRPDVWGRIFVGTSDGGAFNLERFYLTCHSTMSSSRNIDLPELDKAIEQVPMTPDLADRKKLAQKAIYMCKEQYTTLTYLETDAIFALGKKIGDFKPIKGLSSLGPVWESITRAP